MFETILYKVLHGRPFRGELEIICAGKSHVFGAKMSGAEAAVKRARIRVLDKAFFRRVILNGDAGFGEAFFLGEFETEDLPAVLDWFIANSAELPSFRWNHKTFPFFELAKPFQLLLHKLRRNTRRGSKRNIESHYDVSNEFYQLWLDPSLAYSAAIFAPGLDLAAAQENKFRTICESIKLQAGDHLLEIGCGWGGFAVYAAKNFDCKITAITISKEQHAYASELVARSGLGDRIEIRLQDYRDLEGAFDKIVSIEMMEALGHAYVPLFARQCERLLKPGGRLLLQCITYPDEHFDSYLKGTDFIRKHIFPGGELIALGHLIDTLEETKKLRVIKRLSLGLDYAQTLAVWRQNFEAQKPAILALGFDENFYRKWLYYFLYCESGFRSRYIDDYQITVEKKA